MPDRVEVGTPITTDQAVWALLRMIKSPIVGDVYKDIHAGSSLHRIKDHCYEYLSSGERKLVDIAESLWRGPVPAGAHISAIGGLDRNNRRSVLLVLLYYYLGRDVWVEATTDEFDSLFIGGGVR